MFIYITLIVEDYTEMRGQQNIKKKKSTLMFRWTVKRETELNLVALTMEEESFFESWEEADCPTSWTNPENPLFQTWDVCRLFVFNATTDLRFIVGKQIYMATAAFCDSQLFFFQIFFFN